MSLHDLAKEMASKGRGDDSVLIHMTPGEVGGLQQLAMAHGGSLTINPDTGLPEAGILKSLLPTLIGAVLTPLTGGLINPLTAGLLVGGVEGLRTGDIGKGLMAGLGAYGGAGLSAGLAGLGGIGAKTAATAGSNALAAGPEAFTTLWGQGANVAGTAGTAAGEALKGASKEALTQAGKQALGAGYQGVQPSIGAFFNAPGQVAKGGFTAIGEGAKALANTPMQGIGALGRSLGPAGIAGVGGSLATAMTPEQKTPDMAKPETSFYKTTYSPGTVNPRFGEPGQSYFVGQGYGPGTRSKTYQDRKSVV